MGRVRYLAQLVNLTLQLGGHMLKHSRLFCKIVMVVAIIGALNWGLVGVANFNLVDYLFGVGSILTRSIYTLVGLSGIALLVGFFKSHECKDE